MSNRKKSKLTKIPPQATNHFFREISVDIKEKLNSIKESKDVPDLTTICRNYLAICAICALSLSSLKYSFEIFSFYSIMRILYGSTLFVGGIVLAALFLASGTLFFLKFFLIFLERYGLFVKNKPWLFTIPSALLALALISAVPTISALAALAK